MTEDERLPEDLNFEDAMESLESIVSSLEAERLPLEEMVQGYERGVKLLHVCRSRIDSARQRVEIITADLEGKSKATLTEFAAMETPESSINEETPKRPTKKKPEKPTSENAVEGDIRLF